MPGLPLPAMRRTRSRHVGRSVVSVATTPNRNSLVPPVTVEPVIVPVLIGSRDGIPVLLCHVLRPVWVMTVPRITPSTVICVRGRQLHDRVPSPRGALGRRLTPATNAAAPIRHRLPEILPRIFRYAGQRSGATVFAHRRAVPAGMSYEQAAALPRAGAIALPGIRERGQVRPGAWHRNSAVGSVRSGGRRAGVAGIAQSFAGKSLEQVAVAVWEGPDDGDRVGVFLP